MDGFCRRGWQEKTRRLARISLQGVMALYVPSLMNCDIFFHYYYTGGLGLWSSWEFPAAWLMMLVLLTFGDYLLVGDLFIYFNTAACVLFFRAFSFGFIRGTRVHLQGGYSALPSNWESLPCPCYESVGNPDYNSFWTFHMNCFSRELKDFEDFIASQIVQQDSLTGFMV